MSQVKPQYSAVSLFAALTLSRLRRDSAQPVRSLGFAQSLSIAG